MTAPAAPVPYPAGDTVDGWDGLPPFRPDADTVRLCSAILGHNLRQFGSIPDPDLQTAVFAVLCAQAHVPLRLTPGSAGGGTPPDGHPWHRIPRLHHVSLHAPACAPSRHDRQGGRVPRIELTVTTRDGAGYDSRLYAVPWWLHTARILWVADPDAVPDARELAPLVRRSEHFRPNPHGCDTADRAFLQAVALLAEAGVDTPAADVTHALSGYRDTLLRHVEHTLPRGVRVDIDLRRHAPPA